MGRNGSVRIHGWAAAGAVLAERPDAVRCVHLRADRVAALGPVLKRLAARHRPYRIVEDRDLEALAKSPHHEGIVVEVPPKPGPRTFASSEGQWLLLDGGRNPHNLGAILRSAAHFDARGVWALDGPELAGAAARVAEGGAEFVPYAAVPEGRALSALEQAPLVLGTRADPGAPSLFDVPLADRVVWVLGSEASGARAPVADRVHGWVRIPGSGRVESLNVSVAAALVLAEWARRHPLSPSQGRNRSGRRRSVRDRRRRPGAAD